MQLMNKERRKILESGSEQLYVHKPDTNSHFTLYLL